MAYLKSFSERSDNLLMWSTYADNYAGMCVEYDVSKISDNLIYHLFPVVYTLKRKLKANLNISAKELSNFKYDLENQYCPEEIDFLQDIMSLFLVKFPDWEYEKEWRLIVTCLQMHGEDEDPAKDLPQLYKVTNQIIDFPYAKTVYLGPKMKENVKDHIRKIAKDLSIEVVALSLSETKFALEAK